MTGNSRDRRWVKRLIKSIVQPKEQLSIWQQLSSFAVAAFVVSILLGIGGVLMTPAPVWIPDAFFGVALLIAVVGVFRWKDLKSESPQIRFWVRTGLIGLILITASILTYYNHKNPPYSFPWIRTAYMRDDSIGIQVCVREAPIEEDLHTSTLAHFQVTLWTVKSLSTDAKTGSWSESTDPIATPIKAEKWSNEDCKEPYKWLPVTKPVVLEFNGSSEGANWVGYVVLTRVNGHVQRYESVTGWVSLPRSKVHFSRTEERTENDKGSSECASNGWTPLTKERLTELGIPQT